MTFGYYDTSKFIGEMNWHPITKKDLYVINFDDIKINGKAVGLCNDPANRCQVAIDTGASTNMIPPWANDFIKKQGMLGADNYIDCNKVEDVGQFTFVVDGIDYSFEPSEWATALAENDQNY